MPATVRCGTGRKAGTRRHSRLGGIRPHETKRCLPGDPGDVHSRYVEAAVDGILIGCLYLPNRNPAPGPKLEYKLRWLERLKEHAASLLAREMPVILAGVYNVIPRGARRL